MAEMAGYSTGHFARFERGETELRESVYQYLMALGRKELPARQRCFTFIDLFAGIGGFRKGFDAVGGSCVFTSEWDEYAKKTYRANFGDHEVHGDITKINAVDIPDHDILVAGFPCQPFSIAGVSKKNSLGRKHGFECETQGTLFFDIERIIREKQP
jgi:DNA (cytosine-5)-methyltransferase 1